jgi:protein SCO1/2
MTRHSPRTPQGSRRALKVVLSAIIACSAVIVGDAQMTGTPTPGYRVDPGLPASVVPAPLREIGFDQNLNHQVPLDVELRDERGRVVRLGEYFRAKPVVMAFVYYDCPMLCSRVLSAMISSLNVLALEPARDFEVVAVSFDPRETPAIAAVRKAAVLERYDRQSAAEGLHFLTGDQPSIDRLTKAAGFRYVWDQQTRQFAHPAGLVVLTPDGRLARYLFGLEYGPRDLRFALVEASSGRVGRAVDALLLYCYHYDPMTGRYGFVVMRALRLAGGATVLGLAAFIAVMVRRDRRRTLASGREDPAFRSPGGHHPALGA